MAHLSEAAAKVTQLKNILSNASSGKSNSQDLKVANDLLLALKLGMTQFTALPGGGATALSSPTAQQELLIARETFESAALLSVLTQDFDGFGRYVSQVKMLYFDYGNVLPESALKLQILGLNLMRLLAQNLIAEFHTELEFIPADLHDSMYIKFPIQLEQYLMEGSYNKILQAKADVPAVWYTHFINVLTDTVRDAIADCSESAYVSLSLHAAQKLFICSSQNQLLEYCKTRAWEVDVSKGIVHFRTEAHTSREIPSMKVIQETLAYAKELERIV